MGFAREGVGIGLGEGGVGVGVGFEGEVAGQGERGLDGADAGAERDWADVEAKDGFGRALGLGDVAGVFGLLVPYTGLVVDAGRGDTALP